METIVGCLIVAVIVLGYNVYQLMGEVETNRQNLSDYSIWFKDEWVEKLAKDLDKMNLEQRQMFCVLWEYFYVMMAVRGGLDVNKETFITDGLHDIARKYPACADFMEIKAGKNETDLFEYWFLHYVNFCKQHQHRDRVEAIFQKHANPPGET